MKQQCLDRVLGYFLCPICREDRPRNDITLFRFFLLRFHQQSTFTDIFSGELKLHKSTIMINYCQFDYTTINCEKLLCMACSNVVIEFSS